jgi:hypothetical protein
MRALMADYGWHFLISPPETIIGAFMTIPARDVTCSGVLA